MRGIERIGSWTLLASAVLALCLGAATDLQADTINFSDLGAGCSPAIPSNYHGLTWSSNFQVECNADYASSYGNSYGAPSGFAVTNGGALMSGLGEISIATGAFDFLGAEFSAFAGSDTFQFFSAESLAIYGFKPGDAPDTPTFTTLIDLNAAGYDFHSLNYTGVDLVLFGAGTGPATDPNTVFGVDGLSWLMTDVDVNLASTAVPEPAVSLLLGAGLTILALWRKSVSKKN